MELTIERTLEPKQPPVAVNSFGKIFTDHMFVMDYIEEKGWHNARIIPHGHLSMGPAASTLHYGQGIFEGLKAYKDESGQVRLFRPEDNFLRFNRSAKRLCMPEIDVEFTLSALYELIKLEQHWIPTDKNTSLYIRPYMIATEDYLGVRPSKQYQFCIILSPSGSYYAEGLDPVNILVEENYVRAVRGGLGEAKTMANYAASLLAGEEAIRKGYAQVLWLDGVERKYIEEVGTMNIFFKIAGKVITPPLTGTILPGITRDSVIKVLKQLDIPVEEYRLSIDEVIEAHQNGTLEEVFGTGTAAVISPVGKLTYKDIDMEITGYDKDSVSLKLYDYITSLQTGNKEDEFGWVIEL